MAYTIPTFDDVFSKYQTDKVSHHSYGQVYDQHLSYKRDRVQSVLEIGVYRGGSLAGWREYFPKAQIYGLDIEPSFRVVDDRITTITGDQGNPALLKRVGKTYGPFDLIVDDGSHDPHDQLLSLLYLWEHLTPGGIYAIEDVLESRYFGPDPTVNPFSYLPGEIYRFDKITDDTIFILQKD